MGIGPEFSEDLVPEEDEEEDEGDVLDPGWSIRSRWFPADLVFGKGEDGLPSLPPIHPELEMPATHDNMVCLPGCGKPKCRYLKRIVTGFPAGNLGDKSKHPVVNRYCEKLSVQGEMMDLAGSPVYACEFRSPPCSPEHGLQGVEVQEAIFAKEFPDSTEFKVAQWTSPIQPKRGLWSWLRKTLSRLFTKKSSRPTS